MSPSIALIFALFILLVILLSWLKTRDEKSGFPWLRLFFPSWRFFEDFDRTPVLMYRLKKETSDFTEWQECFPAPTGRKVQALFLNSADLARLAVQDLVDQLLREIRDSSNSEGQPDPEAIEQSLPYRLVLNAVRFCLRHHDQARTRQLKSDLQFQPESQIQPDPQFQFDLQFKVVLRSDQVSGSPRAQSRDEDLFLSAVHAGGAQ